MMSRRRVLLSAVAAGAAAGLPGRTAAATPAATAARATADTVPETLAAFSGPGRLLGAPDFPIGHLGVTWSGPRLGGSLRFRHAAGWGPWQPLRPGDSSGHGRSTALVPADGAIAYQLTPPADAGDVQLVAINTTDGPPVQRHSGALDVDQLAALRELVVARYAEGLAAEGCSTIDEGEVRFGLDGALALRSAFLTIPLHRLAEPVTEELTELFDRRLRLTRYLVDLGLAMPVDA